MESNSGPYVWKKLSKSPRTFSNSDPKLGSLEMQDAADVAGGVEADDEEFEYGEGVGDEDPLLPRRRLVRSASGVTSAAGGVGDSSTTGGPVGATGESERSSRRNSEQAPCLTEEERNSRRLGRAGGGVRHLTDEVLGVQVGVAWTTESSGSLRPDGRRESDNVIDSNWTRDGRKAECSAADGSPGGGALRRELGSSGCWGGESQSLLSLGSAIPQRWDTGSSSRFELPTSSTAMATGRAPLVVTSAARRINARTKSVGGAPDHSRNSVLPPVFPAAASPPRNRSISPPRKVIAVGRPSNSPMDASGDSRTATVREQPVPMSRRRDQRRKARQKERFGTGGPPAKTRPPGGLRLRAGARELDGGVSVRQVLGACDVESYNVKKLYEALIQRREIHYVDADHTVVVFHVPPSLLEPPREETSFSDANGAPLSSSRQRRILRARSVDAAPPVLSSVEDGGPEATPDENKSWCFVFAKFGVAVLWAGPDAVSSSDGNSSGLYANVGNNRMSELMFFLSQFADEYHRPDWAAEESMSYCHIWRMEDPELAPASRIKHDTFFLKTQTLAEKLAASFAIAQSLRLDVFESALMSNLKRVEQIPQQMSESEPVVDIRGRYDSEKNVELRKQIARLYCSIIDVNVFHDFLEVPRFFWEDDRWQNFWNRVHAYLEIKQRLEVLNKRYLFIQELLEVVNEVRRESQESRLTWVIIWLLVVQCVCVFVRCFIETSDDVMHGDGHPAGIVARIRHWLGR